MVFFLKYKSINAQQAKKLLDENQITLVDTREHESYQKSHIPGAIHIHDNNIHQLDSSIDKTKPILCYCYKGKGSRLVCKKLYKAGFRLVFNLKGGYESWEIVFSTL